MSLYKTIHINTDTQIFIWKITESYDELFQNITLTDTSLTRLQQMKSTQHQKAFLAVRYLLRLAGYSDRELYYSTSGKPNLSDSKHISISHSFDYAVVMISSANVGIDIELQRKKILRVKDKFSDILENPSSDWFDTEKQIHYYTIIWSAKEAIYKYYSQEGLRFKEDIFIQPFNIGDNKLTAKVLQNKTHTIHHFTINNYIINYIL
ncbi:MAG: 4'-phosphopantetheinyl transferase superfamily protein [Bacteroidota bacterium]|nr:4'-phosphopantetheinyl transferase superfamily protein [Bacteroidota bacterium]